MSFNPNIINNYVINVNSKNVSSELFEENLESKPIDIQKLGEDLIRLRSERDLEKKQTR